MVQENSDEARELTNHSWWWDGAVVCSHPTVRFYSCYCFGTHLPHVVPVEQRNWMTTAGSQSVEYRGLVLVQQRSQWEFRTQKACLKFVLEKKVAVLKGLLRRHSILLHRCIMHLSAVIRSRLDLGICLILRRVEYRHCSFHLAHKMMRMEIYRPFCFRSSEPPGLLLWNSGRGIYTIYCSKLVWG